MARGTSPRPPQPSTRSRGTGGSDHGGGGGGGGGNERSEAVNEERFKVGHGFVVFGRHQKTNPRSCFLQPKHRPNVLSQVRIEAETAISGVSAFIAGL